jgi:hypothetical protein
MRRPRSDSPYQTLSERLDRIAAGDTLQRRTYAADHLVGAGVSHAPDAAYRPRHGRKA